MERARLASDRRLTLPPDAAQDRLLHALRGMGSRIVRATPGTVEVLRGGRIRSAFGATDRALHTVTTIVGSGDTCRVLTLTETAHAVDLNASPEALAAEVIDMLVLQQAGDDAVRAQARHPFGPALL